MATIIDLPFNNGSHGATSYADQSGNSYTPTFQASAALSALRKTVEGDTTSLFLNSGSNQYLQYSGQINELEAFANTTTGDATLEISVFHRSINGRSMLFTCGDNTYQWALDRDYGSSNKMRLYFWNGSGTPLVMLADDSDPPTGRWIKYVLVKKGGASAAEYGLYIDGQQKAYLSSNVTIPLNDSSPRFTIGNSGALTAPDAWISRFKYSNTNVYNASPNSGKTDTIAMTYVPRQVATARKYTSGNTEYHVKPYASLVGLNPGDTTIYGGGIFYLDSTSNSTIFSRHTENGNSNAYALMIISNALRWTVMHDGQTASGVNAVHGTTLQTGQWYGFEVYHDHVANKIGVTLNRTGLVETNHSTGIYASGTSDFVVGALDPDSGNKYALSGRIAKLWFYNLIPADAIRDSLYNYGAGKHHHELTDAEKTGLISYYDCVETSGDLLDALANNNLTDTNTVTFQPGNTEYTAITGRDLELSNSEYFVRNYSAGDDFDFSSANPVWYCAMMITPESLSQQLLLISKTLNNTDTGYQWDMRYRTDTSRFVNYKMYGTTDVVGATADNFGAWAVGQKVFLEAWNTGTALGICVNRGADNTTNDTNNYRATTGKTRIGCRATVGEAVDTGSLFDGVYGQIIFIRTAVPTTAERNALFNRGFGCTYANRPALSQGVYKAWFSCNETSGDLIDETANNYDFTDTNTVGSALFGMVYDAPSTTTAPLSLTATAISSSTIELDWQAPADDGGAAITGYLIEYESPVDGGWSTLVADTESTDTAYTVDSLNPSTEYNFRVSAINSVGTSTPSNEASDTTDALPSSGDPEDTPNIEFEKIGLTKVTLSKLSLDKA